MVRGELFFVSVGQFLAGFERIGGAERVELDFTHAHVWDASAVESIDRVVLKLRRAGATVTTHGLNAPSSAILERLAVHDRPEHVVTVGQS